ncbi:MAG TPA: imidazole glycerol phosphate synthase subunit HisH [Gemmatimonadales bacterium]|nr:imidazole glycerol phosphate synthase subunit HisH [Gemmatimonadales bacterium]
MTGDVVVVRTGSANLASVLAALQRLGATPRLSSDVADIRRAERLVLPGVGSYGGAQSALARAGLVEAFADRVRAGSPLLAICLGLQLLAEGSDESPGVRGMGLIAGCATRLPDSVRVPQLGWNTVTTRDDTSVLRSGFAYYANSYALRSAPDGWSHATTTHGAPFVAAIARGPQLACQFHPELSGRWGHALLTRWWAAC